MFVVKLFASSAILLGNWSVRWGLDEPTFAAVVRSAPADPASPPAPQKKDEVDSSASDSGSGDKPVDAPAQPVELGKIESATRSIINFWKTLMGALVAGYQAGFLWVAAVGIYLLLRHDIDGVQMNDVYIDQAEEYGLPPLAEDPATGVPEVNPHGAPIPGDTRST